MFDDNRAATIRSGSPEPIRLKFCGALASAMSSNTLALVRHSRWSAGFTRTRCGNFGTRVQIATNRAGAAYGGGRRITP
jgi:hypothetical protein